MREGVTTIIAAAAVSAALITAATENPEALQKSSLEARPFLVTGYVMVDERPVPSIHSVAETNGRKALARAMQIDAEATRLASYIDRMRTKPRIDDLVYRW